MNLIIFGIGLTVGFVLGFAFYWRLAAKRRKTMITRQMAKQGACNGIDNIRR